MGQNYIEVFGPLYCMHAGYTRIKRNFKHGFIFIVSFDVEENSMLQ